MINIILFTIAFALITITALFRFTDIPFFLIRFCYYHILRRRYKRAFKAVERAGCNLEDVQTKLRAEPYICVRMAIMGDMGLDRALMEYLYKDIKYVKAAVTNPFRYEWRKYPAGVPHGPWLENHEDRHIWQVEQWVDKLPRLRPHCIRVELAAWVFLIHYGLRTLRYGYKGNPYELDANTYADSIQD